MPSTRCQCYTKENLVCKKKFCFILENKRYCHVHAKQIYNKNIIKIQSMYRSYKCRQKIDTLLKPLPFDIQNIVLNYLREPYYIDQSNKCICKILSNRVDKYIGNLKYPPFVVSRQDDITQRQVKFYTDIIDIYNLYNKYFNICNYDYCYRLYGVTGNIWNLYKSQIHQEELLLDDSNHNIVIDDNFYNLSKNLYDCLTDYQTIFQNNYRLDGHYTPIKIYFNY
jgi:hypothetical protein